MSGNIGNGRKGASEATRYTYLHFGGVGISFRAHHPDGFIALASPEPPPKEIALKMLASSVKVPEDGFFDTGGGEVLSASLLWQHGHPRYWYSGPESKEDEVLTVVSMSHPIAGASSVLAASYEKVYQGDQAIYTEHNGYILSAAYMEDPVDGKCLFVVSTDEKLGASSSTPAWPYIAKVIRVKDSQVVRSKVLCGFDFGYERDLANIPTSLSGSHSLDGKVCTFIVRGGILEGDQVRPVPKVCTLNSDLDLTWVDSLTGSPWATYQHDSTTSASSSDSGDLHTSTPPGAGSGSFMNARNKSSNESSHSSSSTAINQRATLWKEQLHSGEWVTITIQEVSSTSLSDASSLSYKYDMLNEGYSNYFTNYVNYSHWDGASFTTAAGFIKSHFEKSSAVSESRVLSLWDGVSVALTSVATASHSNETSDFNHDARQDSNYISDEYALAPDFYESEFTATGTTSSSQSFTFSASSTTVHRSVLAFCVQAKAMILSCSSHRAGSSGAVSGGYSSSFYEYHYSVTGGVPVNIVDNTGPTPFSSGGTSTVGISDSQWYELILGGTTHRFGVRPVQTQNYESPLGVPHSDGGTVTMGNYSHENHVSGRYYYDCTGNSGALVGQAGSFIAFGGHLVGLDGAALAIIPLYSEEQISLYSWTDPNTLPANGYKVVTLPAGASTSKELNIPLASASFIHSVYPTE